MPVSSRSGPSAVSNSASRSSSYSGVSARTVNALLEEAQGRKKQRFKWFKTKTLSLSKVEENKAAIRALPMTLTCRLSAGVAQAWTQSSHSWWRVDPGMWLDVVSTDRQCFGEYVPIIFTSREWNQKILVDGSERIENNLSMTESGLAHSRTRDWSK